MYESFHFAKCETECSLGLFQTYNKFLMISLHFYFLNNILDYFYVGDSHKFLLISGQMEA